MVIIVQLEERKTVDLDVRGSRPFNHPYTRDAIGRHMALKMLLLWVRIPSGVRPCDGKEYILC